MKTFSFSQARVSPDGEPRLPRGRAQGEKLFPPSAAAWGNEREKRIRME